jgi:hypothetical protein
MGFKGRGKAAMPQSIHPIISHALGESKHFQTFQFAAGIS